MKVTKTRYAGVAGTMAGHTPSTGVWYDDTGGDFGGGTLTVAEILALIAAGLAPNAFYLRRQGGGSDTQDLGTLGASPIADLANASVFLGELDQDASITLVGFLPAGRRSEGAFAITEDGTGGWTPTFVGFTWIGGTPTWDTTAGTVTHVVFFSDDGGVTIYAAVVGGGGSGSAIEVLDEGVSLTAALASMDFVGDGVTATTVGDAVTVTIPGLTAAAVAALGFVGPILMTDGITSPPEPLWNDDGTDYLYEDMGLP